ncbi:hypothetical protein QVD17_31786 [Tagetes erecta]|uniref:Uncharacterized protein n=1 Tax=Tagetes erecta TaxID=13708 RepID=A0AAD8NPM8_TARER|nr:hypothetical protein QVD17_31786 [Tagetes erecta]
MRKHELKLCSEREIEEDDEKGEIGYGSRLSLAGSGLAGKTGFKGEKRKLKLISNAKMPVMGVVASSQSEQKPQHRESISLQNEAEISNLD